MKNQAFGKLIGFVCLLLLGCTGSDDSQDGLTNDTDTSQIVLREVPMNSAWKDQRFPSQPKHWTSIQAIDSMAINSDILLFQPVKTNFSSYHQDQFQRDSVSSKYPNIYHKALAIERYLEATHDSTFFRNSDTLTFTSDAVNHWYLVNSDSQKHCVESFLPEKQLFLIKTFYQSGTSYLLINGASGYAKKLWGLPYFSPGGTQLISINNDQKIQYSANGIQYFKCFEDSISLQWEQGINNWGPAKMRWISDDTLVIQREYLAPNESEEVYLSDAVQVVIFSKSHPAL